MKHYSHFMMNWLPVFNDSKLDLKLKRDGIVKFALPDDLMIDACENVLSNLVPNYDKNIGENFYGSVSLKDIATKLAVHHDLGQLVTPFLNSIISNHKLLTYFYLVKVKGSKSILQLHQDWSIIDERKYRAYNLWIPLCDSTVENGTLHVLKGSQNFPLNIRGANIPPKYLDQFELAKRNMKPIDVKKGEALLFDSRLLHYSPANLTDQARTAIINNIIPTQAETFSFFGRQGKDQLSIDQYQVPADLFIHYDDFVNQKDLPNPKGEFMGRINYGNTDSVLEEEFNRLVQQFAVKKKWYQFF